MSETAVLHPASASPLKAPSKKAKGEKKQKKPSTHPPVNDMIVAALKTLKDRKGTSLQAVKKYISANYTCDVEKLSPFIKKSLKSGVEKGKLVHTKGTGASGSFKLKLDVKKAPGAKKAKGVAKKKPATGEKKARKPKTAGTKAGLKKAKAAPAKKAKKVAGVKKAASLKQKSTKHSKTVAKKPKTPKPKKAAGGAKKKPAAKK